MRPSPFPRLLRALACSLPVFIGLPAASFASPIDYFTGPETAWLDTLDAAPSADQTLTADRSLRSLKLDAGVDVSLAGFALTLESGALITGGDAGIMIAGGTLGSGGSSALRIQTDNTGDTAIGSTLVGSGGLVKTGAGALLLSGQNANTYAGPTTVNAGTLDLGQYYYDGVVSIPGDLVIGDGQGIDTVRLHGSEQVADTSAVTLRGGSLDTDTDVARLDLNGTYYYGYNGRRETLASLVVAGHGELDFGHSGPAAPTCLFLETLSVAPDSRLTIRNWTPYSDFLLLKKTGGVDPADLSRIVFDDSGLTVSILPYDSDYDQIAPCPVITFPSIPDQADGAAPLVLGATASAGGAVYYEVVSGFATLLEDWKLRLDHPGVVTIRAMQVGNDEVIAAVPVERTFAILPGARPANDDFSDAAVLAGDFGTVTGDNHFATGEATEPGAGYDYPPGRSVWWRWTAPADGQASFDNRDSALIGSVEIFEGPDLASLTWLGTADNDPRFGSPALVPVAAGVTYHIRVRGYENITGALGFDWAFLTTPVLKPAARITSQGFTASWSGGSRASYRLEIFDTNDDSAPRFVIPVTDATSRTVRGLDSDTVYRFRVVVTDGADLALPSETLTFQTLPSNASPPPNDSIASAIELTPSGDNELGGSIDGHNRHATNESSEGVTPLASVWYRWTPPATGLWRLQVAASFPATLTLYADADLADATPLASTHDERPLDWETRADTPYLIQIAGRDAAQGTFTLTWELVRADELPANDHFADAAPLPAFPEVATASNRHATVEADELEPGVGSLWWRWTAPLDGVASVGKTSDFTSRLLVFEATELDALGYRPAASFSGEPRFTVRAGVTYYLRIDGQPSAPRGTTSLSLRFVPRPVLAPATTIGETGFTVSWTHAAGPCVLRIYDYLDPYDGNDNAYISPVQTIRLSAGMESYAVTSLRPGTDHYYTIATTTFGIEQRSALGAAATLPASEEPPANDRFSEAAVLTPEGGELTVNNRYASNESGEADDDDEFNAGRASLWYAWTAPATGEWRFSLAGSIVPAAIEIRGDESHFFSSPIMEDSGSPADGAAECVILAREGETFHITLLAVGDARGDLALSWSLVRPLSPPANDAFENAQIIEGSSGSVPVTLDLASANGFGSGPYPIWMPDVWLRWQAPATEKIRFTLGPIGNDSGFWLYTGESLDALTPVYSDSDFDSAGSLVRDWPTQSGVVYYLRIHGAARLGADATLAWSPAPPPDPAPPASPAPLVVTRGARFVTLRLPPRDETDFYRVLVVSTHADLSEPVHQLYLWEDAGDYVVPGLLPSTRYHYQLEDYSDAPPSIGVVDTIPDKSAPPANNVFHPTKIPASGGSVKGTTKNANAMSVWYSFTPATSGLWKVRVSATDHDSYFAVHRAATSANAFAGFVLSSSYDNKTGQNFEPARTVERLAPLRAGVTYLVEVIDYPGHSGAFTLSLAFASPLAPPVNDDFAAATVITGRTGSFTGDLRIATRQPEEQSPHLTNTGYNAAEHTIWWRWTALQSGRMRFALGGAPAFAPDIAVFTGDTLATLQGLARDRNNSDTEVSVVFDAVVGTTYHIRAGAHQPPGGIHTLTWASVGILEQSIDFPQILTPVSGPTTVSLSATASSGLPVTYRVLHGGPATIEGSLLHFTGAGGVTVLATQLGDDFYAPADPVTSYIASPLPIASQSISFPWPGDRYVGSTPGQLLASADSGLPVEFEIVSGPATVAGNLLSVTGPGKVVVRATQPGAGTIPAAPPVEHMFSVLKAPTIPAIALAPVTRVYNGLPQAVTATTRTASLTATYLYKPAKGPASATPPTDAGTYTVTATLDDPAAPAPAKITSTLIIAKAPLIATGPELTRLVGEPNPASFAITYRGFVNGEDATALDKPPVATTKAHAKSTAGVYPITLSGGSDNNYAITRVPGRLTVLGFDGSYEALLFDSRAVALGKLEITVPPDALAFSGTLTLAGEIKSIAIRGPLTGSKAPLSATGVWSRSTEKGTTPLSLTFRLAGDILSGSLRLGEEDVLTIPANNRARLYTPATKTVPPWAGAHTFLLSDPVVLDEADERPLPRGAGHATAAIGSAGGLTLKGRLSDGTPLTTSARLDTGFRYRLFVKPYAKRADSFLSGPLALAPHPDEVRFPGRVHAAEGANLLVWAKAALPETTKPSAQDKTYRAGFAVDVLASLDPWLPPAAAKKGVPAATLVQRLGLPTDENGAAILYISYDADVYLGHSQYSLPVEAALGRDTKLRAAEVSGADHPVKWTVTLAPDTGAFSGSFTLTDTIEAPTVHDLYATKPHRRKVTFTGVLRQTDQPDAPVGQGFFLLDPLPEEESPEKVSGEIRFTAP